MLLRRISKHVRNQNWFAVFLDFFIVVVGVFIGIQVANWNEGREDFRQETKAMVELRKELADSIVTTGAQLQAYGQAADAGKRSLAFIDGSKVCGDKCWDVVVDFMHASQWQDISVNTTSYENMRAQGFPENTAIVDAVEAYRIQNRNNMSAFSTLPVYRSLVRQMINIQPQEYYWANCWALVDGMEEYRLDCPEGMSAVEAKQLVNEIVNNPNIKLHLTEWTGSIVSLPDTMGQQNDAAQKAIDLIDAGLEKR